MIVSVFVCVIDYVKMVIFVGVWDEEIDDFGLLFEVVVVCGVDMYVVIYGNCMFNGLCCYDMVKCGVSV